MIIKSQQKQSGLTVLQGVAESHSYGSSIAETMGMHIVSAQSGNVLISAQPDARHLNPMGIVHGGFAATCLDTAAALAVFSTLDADTHYATVDLGIKYFRPLKEHVTYQVSGWMIERTRQLAVADAEIRDDLGKIYAKATATLMIPENK